MRIVFMGTPEFAVASLKAVIDTGHEIAAVITVPDKPAGRGQKLAISAVKEFALTQSITILQPAKLKDPDFLVELKMLNADLFIVVAFRMLPEVVWSMPKYGTINVHASLLPQYRGAAPINHAIMNGETETGVTTFFITKEIDTGPLILQKSVNIGKNETAGELHDKLMILGAQTLTKTLNLIENRELVSIPQSTTEVLLTAPKIFKEDCEIDWETSGEEIFNFIRGLSPYPTAYTVMRNLKLKIFSADFILQSHEDEPGTYFTDGSAELRFACKNGFILIKELQLEGKKRMKVSEFLRGLRL